MSFSCRLNINLIDRTKEEIAWEKKQEREKEAERKRAEAQKKMEDMKKKEEEEQEDKAIIQEEIETQAEETVEVIEPPIEEEEDKAPEPSEMDKLLLKILELEQELENKKSDYKLARDKVKGLNVSAKSLKVQGSVLPRPYKTGFTM